ncbi:hypothetical protein GT037_010184 [Alternaria burnsii]|uniref:Uncharacterized protein n=1 Tax=Alternaria burnsii TaxID=1187904 RepID=A0A8H7AYG9_9PLEO|nr:uncharacterized protein GT037_010184 [Alternaria burnsii]KAF7671662.1 hypothetical protein GT037_010184 [Alternaria burnsii]
MAAGTTADAPDFKSPITTYTRIERHVEGKLPFEMLRHESSCRSVPPRGVFSASPVHDP